MAGVYPLLGLLFYAFTCIQRERLDEDVQAHHPPPKPADSSVANEPQNHSDQDREPPNSAAALSSPPKESSCYTAHRQRLVTTALLQIGQLCSMVFLSRLGSSLRQKKGISLLPAGVGLAILTLVFFDTSGRFDRAHKMVQKAYTTAGMSTRKLAWVQDFAIWGSATVTVPWYLLLRSLWYSR